MKTLFYDKNKLSLFKRLRSQAPKRIYSDGFCEAAFDYGDSHIMAVPEDFEVVSQNDSDEAIIVKFKELHTAFVPTEVDNLIFENTTINRLWVLRTLLYFSDNVIYKKQRRGARRDGCRRRDE